MKLKNSIKKDFKFSDPNFFRSGDDDDKKHGIDFWLCGLPCAYRKRRINFPGDITIRYKRKTGAETECLKILNGSCQAKIFIYEFQNKVIFTNLDSIKKALINHRYIIIPNQDQETEFAAIKISDLNNFLSWDQIKIYQKEHLS